MFNTATVPSDMWICGSCNGGNLIALAKDQCPVCGHTRDNCCKGPGQQYQMSSFCTYDNDVVGYENFDAYGVSQPVGSTAYPYALSRSSTFGASPLRHCIIPGFNEYSDGAGSPAPGSWICKGCGTANSSLTPDFCPACGASRT